MITPRYPPYSGGIETHVREVAPRVAGLGARVTVLTTDRSDELPRIEDADGVRIERVPAWPRTRDWYVAPGIRRVIARRDWDLVHVQGIHTAVAPLAMASAIGIGVPFVVTFHSGGHSSAVRRAARPAQWMAMRPLLARARKLIGVSRFESDLFQRRLRLGRERFAVVRNGAGLLPDAGAATTDDRTDGRILSIGRLERYKGHHRIIAALPHMPDETMLEILGEGPAEGWLREVARQHGVADRVTIRSIAPDAREEMARAIRSAPAVVLLSEYEAHPVAVMEALAQGRPVVVASTTGLTEIAEAGLARAVAIDADPAEVARAVLDQVNDPLPVDPSSLPTWDACAAQLFDVYRLASRRRS